MELPKGFVSFARRAAAELPISSFENLVRSVGESKSHTEEAELVQKMIALVKAGMKENSMLPRSQRDLLLYLVYIDMLGYDTAWAHATVISMCSSKNLLVKKVAYLAASLLIDPASELTIMVTATIQSDLKSDNFLIVSAAQQAVCRFASPELVSVFLPQMIALLKHDRDAIKKKALLVLHRFVQIDPHLAPDIERHFIEKLGYKEPAVMVAALCGLTELISKNPKEYVKLVNYLTSILKQASEGKLGRAYDYHRAPAPFIQMYLLQLLRFLGAADAACASDMASVISEVWRKAETLGNNIGNAVVYECLRTAAAVQNPDVFARQTLASITRLLSSRDNNLKYAAIDVLSRLVHDDVAAAVQHQYAVVECLRSADVTLKRKTLGLLYAMAGPNNIDVVAHEALNYIKESEDEAARKEAAMSLCDLAERFGPDPGWFVDIINQVLLTAGDVLPPSVGDRVVSLLAEEMGRGGSNQGLTRKWVEGYLKLLERPKLPPILLKVICWVVGEHGNLCHGGVDSTMDHLASLPETQTLDNTVNTHLLCALGKLGVKALGQLTPDASRYVESMAHCEEAILQQQATEITQLLQASHDVQSVAFSSSSGAAQPTVFGGVSVVLDAKLSFLDVYEQRALESGSAPYLGLQDRVAMGMTRGNTDASSGIGIGGRRGRRATTQLKFNAYEKAEMPTTSMTTSTTAGGGGGGNTPVSGSMPDAESILGGLVVNSSSSSIFGDFGGPAATSASADFVQSYTTTGSGVGTTGATGSGVRSNEPKIMLVKKDRKWGPQASPPPASVPSPSSQKQQPSSSSSPLADFQGGRWDGTTTTTNTTSSSGYKGGGGGSGSRSRSSNQQPVVERDPEKERLAASLFGGGGGGGAGGGWRSQQPVSKPAADAPNLLGDLVMDNSNNGAADPPPTTSANVMDLLGELNMVDSNTTSTTSATAIGVGRGGHDTNTMFAVGAPPTDDGIFGLMGGVISTPSPARQPQQQQQQMQASPLMFNMSPFTSPGKQPGNVGGAGGVALSPPAAITPPGQQQQQQQQQSSKDPFASLLD